MDRSQYLQRVEAKKIKQSGTVTVSSVCRSVQFSRTVKLILTPVQSIRMLHLNIGHFLRNQSKFTYFIHHAFATYYLISLNLQKASSPQFKPSSQLIFFHGRWGINGKRIDFYFHQLFVAVTPVVAFFSPQKQSLQVQSVPKL